MSICKAVGRFIKVILKRTGQLSRVFILCTKRQIVVKISDFYADVLGEPFLFFIVDKQTRSFALYVLRKQIVVIEAVLILN